ncbi:MAG: glycosyltransferase family 2 protein [Gemmatimonadales bacterium]|nr:MAG: glycosyltransferase family 2 protein [Gemmatimonadales bacterium]
MQTALLDTGVGARPSEGHRISACLIVMNEADRIGDCLASLDFCDEIVVVDSHSTDATRELAAAAGARVIERDWAGHRAQKQFAVEQATHNWILALDADERLSAELRKEIMDLRETNFMGADGWSMPRLSHHLGRWIRHGSWYPNRQLRLFDRRHGQWGGRDPHDRWETQGSVGRLHGDLLHFPYRSFDEHLQTLAGYASISAARMHEEGLRANVFDLVFRPPLRFLRGFIFKRGFLLGWRGLILALLDAQSAWLKYTRLMLLARDQDQDSQL